MPDSVGLAAAGALGSRPAATAEAQLPRMLVPWQSFSATVSDLRRLESVFLSRRTG